MYYAIKTNTCIFIVPETSFVPILSRNPVICRCDGGELCSPSGIRDPWLADILWVCGVLGGGTDDPGCVGVLCHKLEVPSHRNISVWHLHAVLMVVSQNWHCPVIFEKLKCFLLIILPSTSWLIYMYIYLI